jgi:carbon monoxide dehydrogenase subunit G
MDLKSDKVAISASIKDVHAFLSDARNLELILPHDKISDFKANENQCSFKVQGAIVISLIQNGSEATKIFLKSGEKSPFPFKLTVNLEGKGHMTEGFIEFDGEVNPFLKMMVEKPLTKFLDVLAHNLTKMEV